MGASRGQSETLGFALILGLTVISVAALAMFGGSALDSAQQQIGVQSAEHAMSQFDSRVAMVGLGRSGTQTVRFGQSQDGTYTVEPDKGWIRITHHNYTGGGGNTEEVYNQTLGALIYTNGETEIAYQGGGVWRKDSGTTMISPPEFHYRGATLTLPMLMVNGDGSVSGTPVATIRSTGVHKRIYPNQSANYTGLDDRYYTNPVGTGQVKVTVHSEYYEAWADYFRTRTDGEVLTDDANQTATMQLIALGTYGDFNMPLDGNSITLRGIQTHQISNYNITLFDDTSDSADFNNLDWSMYATSGSKEFEINIQKGEGTSDGDNATVYMYYSADGVNYHGWKTESAFQYEEESADSEDWNSDGDSQDKRLVLNFSTNSTITYQSLPTGGGAGLNYFTPDEFSDPGVIDEHPSYSWEGKSYSPGDKEQIGNLTSHYFAMLGPDVELFVEDPSQDTVEERISYGTIEYSGGTEYFLTYLHVTENEVNITVR